MLSLERLIVPGRPRPWVMGHRGASDLAPENSVAGFRTALQAGADLIETDLRFTADGHIVCFTDATLQRMTGDPREVSRLTLAELQRLRLVGKQDFDDERITTLEELLELAKPIGLVLELKDKRFEERARVQKLLDILGDRVGMVRAGVISTDLRLLRAVKAAAPRLVTGHIAMTNPFGNRETEMLGPYWPLLRLNPLYIRQAHRRGQRVCPLDYDLHRRLKTYFNANVDAVISSNPGATRAALEALRREAQGEGFF